MNAGIPATVFPWSERRPPPLRAEKYTPRGIWLISCFTSDVRKVSKANEKNTIKMSHREPASHPSSTCAAKDGIQTAGLRTTARDALRKQLLLAISDLVSVTTAQNLMN